MRLANMLLLPGGIPEQGRAVTLRLRYRGPGGVPSVRDVEAVMLPISEVEELQVRRAAQLAVAAAPKAAGEAPPPPALPEGGEYTVRFLQACLRDQGDLSKRLVEDETDLRALRDGLVGPQYERLLGEYKKLIDQEYPPVVTKADADALEAQARDFSASDQPARG